MYICNSSFGESILKAKFEFAKLRLNSVKHIINERSKKQKSKTQRRFWISIKHSGIFKHISC